MDKEYEQSDLLSNVISRTSSLNCVCINISACIFQEWRLKLFQVISGKKNIQSPAKVSMVILENLDLLSKKEDITSCRLLIHRHQLEGAGLPSIIKFNNKKWK